MASQDGEGPEGSGLRWSRPAGPRPCSPLQMSASKTTFKYDSQPQSLGAADPRQPQTLDLYAYQSQICS